MKSNRLFGSLFDSGRDGSPPRNRLIFWISILLALLFLYLALRDLEWKAFFSTLRNAQVSYLPFLLLWITLSYVTRAYRWRILLNAEKPIPVSSVFLANMAGYLGNAILPARTGELVRAAYIAKKENISTLFALATGLTERLMDVVALVILGTLSLSFTKLVSAKLTAGLNIMGWMGIISVGMIVLLPRFSNRIETLVDKLPLRSASQKEKLSSIVRSFLMGLTSLSNIRRAVLFTALTGLIWLMDATGTVFLAYILSLPLNLPEAFVLLAALGLSSAIPSTPGYVGVYQLAAVLALTPFGFSEAEAVALVLVSQILNLIAVGIWGIVAAGRFGRNSNGT